MNGKSLTPEQEKLNALRQVLPEAFTEGKIDWEKLKATLGEDINFANERYVLNWAGKSDAFKVLQMPTTKTLIPAKEESVNFDDTENIFIEGENLEVLKVLQKSYFGKIKMIYIDPPYNTGNDSFIYPDKFSESKADYEKRVGDKDEEGYMTKDGMFKKNSKENGQYHSNWLNMMMPRLYLAKNLLRQDGAIFVSIDDNEVHNLRLLMNEIFGEENFVGLFPWKKRTAKSDVPFGISQDYEWILSYTKGNYGAGIDIERKYYQTEDFPKDRWRLSDITTQRSEEERPNCAFEMINPKTGKKYPHNPKRVWGVSKDTFQSYYNKGKIVFPDDYDFLNISIPAYRVFESEDKAKALKKFGSENAKKAVSTFLPKEVGMSEDGNKEIVDLFGQKLFSFPKPTSLIKHFLKTNTEDDFVVLDFFAGSGTTAHAVMDLNKKDGGNRRYICIQLPELSDEKSEANKAGYNTIADISKERIRRAGKKIGEEIQAEIKKIEAEITKLQGELPTDENKTEIQNLQSKICSLQSQDLGFKVLKLEDSNFKQWQQIAGKDTKALAEQMKLFVDPVSESAAIENMVYELLLKSGKNLNSSIEKKDSYFKINSNELVLLLEKATQQIIDAVVTEKPIKVIALDKLFKGNDQLKTNTVLQMKDAGVEFKTI
ncbi:MAG: hypothetical protein ABS44_09625 [Chryseobacterium sp. SCN 40-13]|nr:MAG: hypothetical protein ABS44_09625 [Chryseobacterium sp. SCN 40-13]